MPLLIVWEQERVTVRPPPQAPWGTIPHCSPLKMVHIYGVPQKNNWARDQKTPFLCRVKSNLKITENALIKKLYTFLTQKLFQKLHRVKFYDSMYCNHYFFIIEKYFFIILYLPYKCPKSTHRFKYHEKNVSCQKFIHFKDTFTSGIFFN